MRPTPYDELNSILLEFVARLQAVLGTDFIGAYLQGSFATGGFDPHSDVDFVVAVEAELTSRQVASLQAMHHQVFHLESRWAKHLEGSYFPKDVLKDFAKRGEELWYLDHGAQVLVRSGHCNTMIVRWVVREQGVVLAGPQPETLVGPIPDALLRAEILETMTAWGRQILSDPAPYKNRFYQGFIVLNYARMLHDLHRGRPGSKPEGAQWARSELDPAWVDLIDSAWECRPDPAMQAREPADSQAFERTLRFVEYIIEQGRQYATHRSVA